MPWQQSMLNKHWTPSHNLLEFVACNDTELSTLFSLDYDYLKLAARLKNPNCAGNAQFIKEFGAFDCFSFKDKGYK
jgi:hypothetical protein